MVIRIIFFLGIHFTFNTFIKSQINQDSLKNVDFALFLYNQKLYDLAAQEYEKISFIYPKENKHLISLFACYRQLNQFEKIEKKSKVLDLNDSLILKEYLLSLALSDQVDIAKVIHEEKKTILDEETSKQFDVDFLMLQKKWKEADKLLYDKNMNRPAHKEIITKGLNTKYKSPFVGGIFSAMIPGSGRIYAKDTKDGIISMIFIGSTAFQAYRRFDKNGIKSVGGWIYGGLSLGFYIANIYGSVKAVHRFNNNNKKVLHEKAKAVISNYYNP